MKTAAIVSFLLPGVLLAASLITLFVTDASVRAKEREWNRFREQARESARDRRIVRTSPTEYIVPIAPLTMSAIDRGRNDELQRRFESSVFRRGFADWIFTRILMIAVGGVILLGGLNWVVNVRPRILHR